MLASEFYQREYRLFTWDVIYYPSYWIDALVQLEQATVINIGETK